MKDDGSFFNLYRHDFLRVAVAVPLVRVADPVFNAHQTVALMREADERKALVVVFPELGLSAYSCEDLFQQQALLDGCLAALDEVVQRSRELPIVAVVGLPLQIEGLLYNCAAVVHAGRVVGVAPKTYLPNYREFYELRQFVPGDSRKPDGIPWLGQPDAVWHESAVRDRGSAALRVPRRDLRGPVGADSALVVCGIGGCDRAHQSVGVQRDDCEGRLPSRARFEPVGPLPRRVRVQRGGAGRIDYGSRVGRPGHDLRKRQPARRSASLHGRVGPFELQDFNLYYTLRFGYRPSKVAFLAWNAWRDRTRGAWPALPEAERRQYRIADIKHWLGVFVQRFFGVTQFKRSCLPNAPKVGSGGSLSPRSDYRAPSDADAAVWVAELASVPESEPDRLQ